jgi:MoaA/NifB/PqqE/SkfB family radical SAM enzyme
VAIEGHGAVAYCRASAHPARHALELTTQEGYGLLDQIRALGSPIFVITGGDPLEREDLFDLIAASAFTRGVW